MLVNRDSAAFKPLRDAGITFDDHIMIINTDPAQVVIPEVLKHNLPIDVLPSTEVDMRLFIRNGEPCKPLLEMVKSRAVDELGDASRRSVREWINSQP